MQNINEKTGNFFMRLTVMMSRKNGEIQNLVQKFYHLKPTSFLWLKAFRNKSDLKMRILFLKLQKKGSAFINMHNCTTKHCLGEFLYQPTHECSVNC